MKYRNNGLTTFFYNLTIGDNLDVYSMHGYSIFNAVVDNTTMRIQLPTAGLYIIKTGGIQGKIVVH